MKKILVIGGCGYIGRVLIEDLIKNNYKVINIDLILYKDQNKDLNKSINEKIIQLDFRHTDKLKKYLASVDQVIILGGLVGEYITNKYLKLSETINISGIINLIDACEHQKNIKNLVFISTCSNYGVTKKNILVKEDDELRPLSPYAKAKVKIEHHILSKKKSGLSKTILRFATAFGYSQRMRFDLTVNHFCYSMLKHNKIEVYDPETWRPYCHVKDFSRIIIKVLNSDRDQIHNQVYNVGSDINNFTKAGIVNLIRKKLPNSEVVLKKGGIDKRDYRVSFDKINKELNISTLYSVSDGIDEIIKILQSSEHDYLKEDALKFRGNFNILENVK